MDNPKNKYQVMIEKHQADIDAFPMFFAFNREQFSEGMLKLGLNPDDTSKIRGLGIVGGFYRKTDAGGFHKMVNRHRQELAAAIATDKTGEGFILDMFRYELANHEYCYTGDIDETLDALDLTQQDIDQNPALQHGLKKACREQAALEL
jgi:hypothetical protein